jgi:hypothetical protein
MISDMGACFHGVGSDCRWVVHSFLTGIEPWVEISDAEVRAFAVWVSVILGWLLPVSLVLILWLGIGRGGSRFRGAG